MEEVLALALESRGSVWHNTLSLCGSDLAAEVGLAGLAELALLALWGAARLLDMHFRDTEEGDLLKSNDIVSWLDGCNALSNRLYDTSSLVAENDRESSLGILSGKCVGICRLYQLLQSAAGSFSNVPVWHTPV